MSVVAAEGGTPTCSSSSRLNQDRCGRSRPRSALICVSGSIGGALPVDYGGWGERRGEGSQADIMVCQMSPPGILTPADAGTANRSHRREWNVARWLRPPSRPEGPGPGGGWLVFICMDRKTQEPVLQQLRRVAATPQRCWAILEATYAKPPPGFRLPPPLLARLITSGRDEQIVE